MASQSGTWDALCLSKKYLKTEDKFLVLNADDMHNKNSIKKLIKYENAILISQHKTPEKFGVVEFDKNNILLNIEEKPKLPKSNFVSVGVYVLSPKIFKQKKPEPVNGEYYLPTVLNNYIKNENVKVVKSKKWVSIGTPEEYILAHELIR